MKTAQDFYDQIKAALDFFGLRFHDMGKVTVSFQEGSVTFTYGAHSITVRAEEELL